MFRRQSRSSAARRPSPANRYPRIAAPHGPVLVHDLARLLVGLGVIVAALQRRQRSKRGPSDLGLSLHHLERCDQRVPPEQRVIAPRVLGVDGKRGRVRPASWRKHRFKRRHCAARASRDASPARVWLVAWEIVTATISPGRAEAGEVDDLVVARSAAHAAGIGAGRPLDEHVEGTPTKRCARACARRWITSTRRSIRATLTSWAIGQAASRRRCRAAANTGT